ncbi:uncharacterized protein TRUGW13939_01817 [Talaromyces rugulosus]|uniref:BTB domain-containing protein n=1 Tax=Talaromyces rugulosus TaxID=121627 RepID=A0A7H8QLK5_TALRU|nr:uncharacterized protein TRUGW13939_01817 [Talaromyces rugulosus]QKX54728.1 hypothetical protein TRUGW13939_01817 [Talaromyces rugulosus]
MPWSKAADIKKLHSIYPGPTTAILAGRNGAVYYIHTADLASSNSKLIRCQFIMESPGASQAAIDWRGYEEVVIERVLEYLSTRDYPVLQGDGQYCYTGTVGPEQAAWEERTGIKGHSWMRSNHAYGTYQAMRDAALMGGNVGAEMMYQAKMFFFGNRYEETSLECVALSRVLVAFQVLIDLKQPMFPYLGHVIHLIYSAPLINEFGKDVISNLVGRNLVEISEKELDLLLCKGDEFAMDVTNAVSRRVDEQNEKIEKEIALKAALLGKIKKLRGLGSKK